MVLRWLDILRNLWLVTEMKRHRIALFYLWIHFCELNFSLQATVGLPTCCSLLTVVNGNVPHGGFPKSSDRMKILTGALNYCIGTEGLTLNPLKTVLLKNIHKGRESDWLGEEQQTVERRFHRVQISLFSRWRPLLGDQAQGCQLRSLLQAFCRADAAPTPVQSHPQVHHAALSAIQQYFKEQLQHLFLPKSKEFSISTMWC